MQILFTLFCVFLLKIY